jgi:hypothetical protein
MTHSIESTIWYIAFIIQYGGLVAGSVMAVALLAATLYELIVEKVREGHVSARGVVRESADRSIVMNV